MEEEVLEAGASTPEVAEPEAAMSASEVPEGEVAGEEAAQ